MDGFEQNLIDELGRRQEQANLILVQVQIKIPSISGIQNVHCSAWRRYELYRAPFEFIINLLDEHCTIFEIVRKHPDDAEHERVTQQSICK